jgi:hypothetical protein
MSMTQARLISFTGRVLAVVALTAAGGAFLHAQTSSGVVATTTLATTQSADQAPQLNLQMPALDQASELPAFSSSSSSEESPNPEVAANVAEHMNMLNAMQYGGGRQRYGRPRYRGGNTNPDGSPKWDFYAGGGFGVPVGDQFNYASTSWGLQGGGGRMFNRHVGVNLEFDYDEFGMTGTTLNNQEALYNYYINLYNLANPGNPVSPIAGLDGNNHVWSFALEPIYNIRAGEGLGAYVIGGFGFYHKVANFTVPTVGVYCDYYGFCYQYAANQIIDHYTSNAPGLNVGFGLTYKFSRFASERLYAEVRYVYIFNSYKPGVTLDTATPENADVYNDFPQNSQRTSYFPVKFGIRF